MRITMLETRRGSQDGHIVEQFEKDKTYEVAYTMGALFVSQLWAVERKPHIDVMGLPTNPATLEILDKL